MMKRTLLNLCALGFTLVNLNAQSILVNTRLQSYEWMAPESTLSLDLNDFFQVFEGEGPLATFTYDRPVFVENRTLFAPDKDNNGNWVFDDNTPSAELPAFELISAETYTNIYEPSTSDFVWERDLTLSVQLLPKETPITVANFMTYVKDGAYTNTVIHRNEVRNGLPIIQGGGWVSNPSSQYIWDYIETNSPINLERGQSNPQGTLAMARQNTANSATSQFFFNLADNADSFSNVYAVFGKVNDEDLDKLIALGNVTTWNMSRIFSQIPGATVTTPLWSHYYDYADKEAYVKFKSITVNEGTNEGITYSWSFDEDSTTEDQKASFEISLNESTGELSAIRKGNRRVVLNVTGTKDEETATSSVILDGRDVRLLEFFGNLTAGGDENYTNSWFSSFTDEGYPYINSDNWGQLGIGEYQSTSTSRYFKDMTTGIIFFTSPTVYPNFYSFGHPTLDSPTPGWYVISTDASTPESRFFYDYQTEEWVDGNFSPLSGQ